MLLIFGDERLDLWDFPYLMTQGIGIGSGQRLATTPAFGRHARYDVLALVGGHKIPFVFLMARLTARFPPRSFLGP